MVSQGGVVRFMFGNLYRFLFGVAAPVFMLGFGLVRFHSPHDSFFLSFDVLVWGFSHTLYGFGCLDYI